MSIFSTKTSKLTRLFELAGASDPPVKRHLKLYATFWMTLALSGCAVEAGRIEPPIDVVGMVTNPRGTGWTKDFCDDGRLVMSAPNCAQIGGEIYRVDLLSVSGPRNEVIAKKLIIGFPAHALTRKFRGIKHLRLEKSPDDFRTATGIELVATSWSDS